MSLNLINKKITCFFLFVLMLSLFSSGCASATYEITTEDGVVTKKIKWISVGKREIKSLEINPETGTIKLGSSKGDAGSLGRAVENSTETALNLSKAIP
jgi:hypothetical protein